MEFTAGQMLMIIAGSALGGGIAGCLAIYMIILRRKSELIHLSDEKVAEEIVDLKTSIQVIYIAGPFFALVLGVLGLNSIDNVRQALGEGTLEQIKQNIKLL